MKYSIDCNRNWVRLLVTQILLFGVTSFCSSQTLFTYKTGINSLGNGVIQDYPGVPGDYIRFDPTDNVLTPLTASGSPLSVVLESCESATALQALVMNVLDTMAIWNLEITDVESGITRVFNITFHLQVSYQAGFASTIESGISFSPTSQTIGSNIYTISDYQFIALGAPPVSGGTGSMGTTTIKITAQKAVPTLSQWGMVLLLLLLISLGTAFIIKRQRSLAIAGGMESTSQNRRSLFDRILYFKVLVVVLLFLITVISFVVIYYGNISMTDIVGGILSSLIVAYLIHLIPFRQKV